MVATKQQSRRSRKKSEYGVRIAERSYPVKQRGGEKPPPRIHPDRTPAGVGRTAEIAEQTAREPRPNVKVAIDLYDKIWASLPLASKSAGDFNEVPEIVRCFVASHEQLTKRANEAKALLEAVCRHHVQGVRDERVSSERQQQAEEAKIRECMDVAMPTVWLGPELDVNNLNRQPEAVLSQLQKSLQRNVAELVESFFHSLEQLVDKGVIGLIEWRTESLCKFHFFRRLVMHVFQGQTTDERTKGVWQNIDGWESVHIERTERTTGREIHEHVRFEQQLMNASTRHLAAPDLVIPEDVSRLLTAIPEWLSGLVRVAVGECFRERVIRKIEKDEAWEDAVVSQHVFERPVVYFDPAICIGEFVLVGWGQRDHDRELRRRAEKEEARNNRARATDALAVSLLVFAVGLACLLGALIRREDWGWVGWMTMAASLVPFHFAASHHLRSLGVPYTWRLLISCNATAILAGLTISSALLAIFLSSTLLAVLAFVMMVLIGISGGNTYTSIASLTSLWSDE